VRLRAHRVLLPLSALLGFFGSLQGGVDETALADGLPLVPWPRSVEAKSGALTLEAGGLISTEEASLLPLARILSDEIQVTTGLRLGVIQGPAGAGAISLGSSDRLKDEAYTLSVGERAEVRGGSCQGIALGAATLLQALRTEAGKVVLPRVSVEDRPHFPYRGTLLDLARKPHSIETLRQCVVAARFYKICYLHLHLTDENAWVFPSTAFPALGSTNFAWAGGEKPEVYRLEELKELVAFADERGVTFVPELETPGHSGALRGSLPEIFGYRDASGKPAGAGVINMASDRAYQALDTLVGEMSQVFGSSPYFHIGCDETSLGGIEALPEVKSLVEREKLPGPHAVFSYFVNRMDAIVKRHGKRMIVWEGAPLGPIPPPAEVIFMPWVGGARTAAGLIERGYSVISAPWGTRKPYFDPYEVNGAQLKTGERLLLGATSLAWESTEEATLAHLRYAAPLRCEPTYNPESGRDHADFLRRLALADPLLDRLALGFTFRAEGTLAPEVFTRPEPMFLETVVLRLETSLDPEGIRFTLDGSEPTRDSKRYAGPITLSRSATLKARRFLGDGRAAGGTFRRSYRKATRLPHDAIGAQVTIHPDQPGYFGPGPLGLTDGLLAAGDSSGDPGWVGWEGESARIEIAIDFGKSVGIRSVSPHFLRSGGGVELPRSVEIALSDDGTRYMPAAVVEKESGRRRRGWYRAELPAPRTARYLRVSPAPGGEWTFIDEVAVNVALPGPTLRHAALGKAVALATPPSSSYDAPGVEGLTDGFTGRTPHCACLEWLGFEGKDIDATIDLGQVIEVRKVAAHFMQFVWAGIYIPERVEVLVSADGKDFKKAAAIVTPRDKRGQYLTTLSAELEDTRARYVRMVARTNGLWLFLDEILVNPEAEPGPLD
jgi:hexosaminidase